MANTYNKYPTITWLAPVANAAALPLVGNDHGDVRVTLDSDSVYEWNGSSWIPIATPGDVTAITALTGDVSANGPGSVAATIQAGVVSNSKLADMAAHTFKGNNTASVAAPSDLTRTQLTAELNQFTTALKGLVPAGGSDASQFLNSQGSFTQPTALYTPGTQTITAAGSINSSATYLQLQAASAVVTSVTTAIVAGTATGQMLIIQNVGTHTVTIKNAAGTQLPSNADYSLTQRSCITLIWDGSNWTSVSASAN